MSNNSVVEYLGASNDGKCGYCKKTGNHNSHGFWAHLMTTEDYQSIIDRNGRRSGHYCYFPNNQNTCCPMYTIKCDAVNFKMSRSHKKIIKKVNRFLRDGSKEKNRFHDSSVQSALSNEPIPSKEHANIDVDQLTAIKKGKSSISPRPISTISDSDEKTEKSDVKMKVDRPLKKKYMRLERKKAKLAEKGLTLAGVPRRHKSIVKNLDMLLAEEPKNGKHKLEVKLVPGSNSTTNEVLKLFQKYQTNIHNDPPEKNTQRSYERFLVNSPLQIKIISVSAAEGSNINLSYDLFCKYESKIHNSTDNDFSSYNQFLVDSPLKLRKDDSTPPEGFGSFHYQYYLDGVLIAVGVIDILPSCVSSVYFYYDPDYSFLSLGTYASLREIALVRQLSKTCLQLKYYYLGFYIPTCPKMRYKSNVRPSYLLCPEVFTWHLIDENLTKEIDAVHYLRINKNEKDRDAVTKDDLMDVLVLASRNAMKYRDYFKMIKSIKKNTDDREEVFEYASKVGKHLSQNMLLFRC